MKYIDSQKLDQLISQLLSELRPENCLDQEEYRLSQSLDALPIGFSLFSYVLITRSGEVITTEWEPGEFTRIGSERTLVVTLAWASERYPSLCELIQEQAEDAETCGLCSGLKVYGTRIGTDEAAVCVCCSGLGWVLKE